MAAGLPTVVTHARPVGCTAPAVGATITYPPSPRVSASTSGRAGFWSLGRRASFVLPGTGPSSRYRMCSPPDGVASTYPPMARSHTSPSPESAASWRAASSRPAVTARPSSSSISRPPDTAPHTRPTPACWPSAYQATSWPRSGRCAWYLFHTPSGALLPSWAGGTTEQPASCHASAAGSRLAAGAGAAGGRCCSVSSLTGLLGWLVGGVPARSRAGAGCQGVCSAGAGTAEGLGGDGLAERRPDGGLLRVRQRGVLRRVHPGRRRGRRRAHRRRRGLLDRHRGGRLAVGEDGVRRRGG